MSTRKLPVLTGGKKILRTCLNILITKLRTYLHRYIHT